MTVQSVKIIDDSDARVAFELMQVIASDEMAANDGGLPRDRKYWIVLYSECRDAVRKSGKGLK